MWPCTPPCTPWRWTRSTAVALSIPILLQYNGQRGASPRWNTAMKWLFYLYYPAHLFLIGWLQWRA